MPIIFAILGGAAVSWALIETDMAIPTFIWMVIFITLLFVAPTLAWWMLGLTVALAALLLLVAMWQEVLGIIIGVIMFFFLVTGLIHAL